jgi:hypothetical protein
VGSAGIRVARAVSMCRSLLRPDRGRSTRLSGARSIGSGANRLARAVQGTENGRRGRAFWTIGRPGVGLGFWTACPLPVGWGLSRRRVGFSVA